MASRIAPSIRKMRNALPDPMTMNCGNASSATATRPIATTRRVPNRSPSQETPRVATSSTNEAKLRPLSTSCSDAPTSGPVE